MKFFRKNAYYPVGKNNCKCWTYREVDHYANKCKNRNNNKLIETLDGLNCFEFSKEKTLHLCLKNNKGIVENV